MKIKDIKAREIIDSRGNPTVEVDVTLEDGNWARASVPSGASTGKNEAFELRDTDSKRFLGRGVLTAVNNVNSEIRSNLINLDASNQITIDKRLIELDGTENKSRLGSNAILGVSLAVAKASAKAYKLPFHQYISGINSYKMPIPMMNIINGGAHADNEIDLQEFMVMPIAADNINDAIRIGVEIFHCLKSLLKSKGLTTSVGDEGGFAPMLNSSKAVLDFIGDAVIKAGYKLGGDIVFALDAAASEFYQHGNYSLIGENFTMTSEDLVKYYEDLIANYPIISIEDPMSEDDYQGWQYITKEFGDKIQLVGDDLFVTNAKILKQGIEDKVANSILIKVNQIGTLTETLRTVESAKSAGYNTIFSHRSGETEDSTIANITVATNAGQIKIGSLSRSDRLSKYNELIRIAESLGENAMYNPEFLIKYLKHIPDFLMQILIQNIK